MRHKDLNIWIETSSGAQHWRRAALGMSLFSGVLTGFFGFALLFHTASVPLAQEGELGAALTRNDAHSDLAYEFFGYISDSSHEYLEYAPNYSVFSLSRRQEITDEREHIRLFSLFPRSYIASDGRISTIKLMPYGFRLSHHAIGVEQSAPPEHENYIHLSNAASLLQSGLTFDAWESTGASSDAVFGGQGEEEALISLLRSVKRPIVTTPMILSDGTEVQEIRASAQEVSIDTASGITTYASAEPYLLATQNTRTRAFTIRNAPSEPSTPSSLIVDTSPESCPSGSIVQISAYFIHIPDANIIVNNIVDKVSSSGIFTHVCLPVDKM